MDDGIPGASAAPARTGPDPAELERLTSQAREYIRAAKSHATLRAYRADWRHFEDWCRQKGLSALPASPDTVPKIRAVDRAFAEPSFPCHAVFIQLRRGVAPVGGQPILTRCFEKPKL